MTYFVINRKGEILLKTTDLNYAWSVCETAARCGNALDVRSEKDYNHNNIRG